MSRMIIVLVSIMTFSALSVIYIRHLNRAVFVKIQHIQYHRDLLNIEWSKLLLEQATWSIYRIEDTARKELNLIVPLIEQTQFIQIKKQNGQ